MWTAATAWQAQTRRTLSTARRVEGLLEATTHVPSRHRQHFQTQPARSHGNICYSNHSARVAWTPQGTDLAQHPSQQTVFLSKPRGPTQGIVRCFALRLNKAPPCNLGEVRGQVPRQHSGPGHQLETQCSGGHSTNANTSAGMENACCALPPTPQMHPYDEPWT